MKTCGKVLISVAGMVALATAFWIVSRPAEPSYQGKRLSEWLRELDQANDDKSLETACEAIRQMGTNALPFLVNEIGKHDPTWKNWLQELLDKQSVIQWRPKPAEGDQLAAQWAFGILGAAAAPSIPQITLLLRKAQTADSAVRALAGIGSPALPALIEALTNRNTFGRASIPMSLVHIDGDRPARVPVLMECLKDADPTVRAAAAHALGWMRMESASVVPALVPLIPDPDPQVRRNATQAIGRLGVQPELVVPALLNGIGDSDWMTRKHSISALAAFGQDAAAAIPVLERAASSADVAIARLAKLALLRVQCEMRDGAIVRGSKGSKTIALTFTGHGFAEGGDVILTELAKHQVQASFFFTGDFMTNKNFDPLIGRIINENHLLGPHSDRHLLYCSWDKDRKTLVTREQFRGDLEANRRKLCDAADRLDERESAVDFQIVEAFSRRYGLPVNTNRPGALPHLTSELRYFLPAYEHYNRQIADWTAELGMTLINYTPGTRSNADYTGEADKNFVSSQAIFDSILKKEREDPNGLNGFILLLHIGAGPGRADKFHTRFGELLDELEAKGYQFVRVDELLEPKETK